MSFHSAMRALALPALGLLFTSGCSDDELLITHPCEAQLALVCDAGDTRACYDGPSGTDGTGLCKAGTQACSAHRTGFDACLEQVLPAPDDCAAPTSFSCDAANQCGSITLLDSPFADAAY